MDIIVLNISYQSKENELKRFFRGKFSGFGIEAFEHSSLHKKGQCKFTVSDLVKGETFVRHFSAPNFLYFAGRPLKIHRGRQQPDPHMIASIQKRAKEVEASKSYLIEDGNKTQRKYDLRVLECGTWSYPGGRLAFESEWNGNRPSKMIIGENQVTVALANPDHSFIRIDIPYSSIESVTTSSKFGWNHLTLALIYAPKIYNVGATGGQGNRRRVVQRLRGIDTEHVKVIGYAMVYRLALKDHQRFSFLKHNLHKLAKSMPKAYDDHNEAILSQRLLSQKYSAFIKELSARRDLGFRIKFQIQRLVENNYLPATTVAAMLPPISIMVDEFGPIAVAYALKKLFADIPYAGPGTDARDMSLLSMIVWIRELLERDETDQLVSQVEQDKNLLLVHRVQVTPSGIQLEGPEQETKNRILRKYPNEASENFIRVTFMEEDGHAIRYDSVGSLEQIHSWFKDFLQKPLSIAGQDFWFLGFSNSSLREQSCWYMADFDYNGKVQHARGVIAALGKFEDFRSPAKCAARIGQAFTDTPHGVASISPSSVRMVRDVQRNDRVFSDGCATVSLQVMKAIWKNYRFGPKPTLVQIRQAGCKGMLSLDTRLQGEQMLYRPSMKKFDSPHTDIEICGSNRRALPCYLNQQLIKILEDLGVPFSPFFKLQQEAVRRLRDTVASAVNASSFLERNSIGNATNLPWLIQNMEYVGASPLEDQFLRQCVEHTVLGRLRELKHRARIPVDKGVTLYGIMDETGILKEGEIFCRKFGKEITGKMLITRSPALHPGDIQTVLAVDVPKFCPLKALDNCIVFSQRGERDLPSQLSGGDLDGDTFQLIWDSSLQPKITYEPADYQRVDPLDIGRVVTEVDMTNHFVTFMANDQLGRIANKHKQLADLQAEGTMSNVCLDLASLHSTAVDFPKTGIPIDRPIPMSKPLKPDFMAPGPRVHIDDLAKITLEDEQFEESDYEDETIDDAVDPDKGRRRMRYYESQKVLGRLYRAIDEREFFEELQSHDIKPYDRASLQKLWQFVKIFTRGIQWHHLRAPAKSIKQEYNELVQRLRISYGHSRSRLLTEVEVFTGSILGNQDGSLPTRRMRETAKTMTETFETEVGHIIRRICGEAQYEWDEDEDEQESYKDQALERSIACFAVALEDDDLKPRKDRLVSFRYLAAMVCLKEVEIFRRTLDPNTLDLGTLSLGLNTLL